MRNRPALGSAPKTRTCRNGAARRAAGALLAGALALAGAGATPAQAVQRITPEQFADVVSTDAVMGHVEQLQRVADENGGDRSAGRPGYTQSMNYVVSQLRQAGYAPQVQRFTFTYRGDESTMRRTSPSQRTYRRGIDFSRNVFRDGHNGSATGRVVPVDLRLDAGSHPANTSTSGCEASDFAGFPRGAIALVQRGWCNFDVKTANAEAAGAAGVVLMNEGQPGRTGLYNLVGGRTRVPVMAVTFDVGAELARLAQQQTTQLSLAVSYVVEPRYAYNILAESTYGNPNRTVMAGAHLDGTVGAGISDNASGSAALLEVAIQYKRNVYTNSKMRFAWWGAEELGMLGSQHYVDTLGQADRDRIAAYLNFDMIASPNYVLGVYDGDNSSGWQRPGYVPAGSAQIEKVFEDFFFGRGEFPLDSEFTGWSDYDAFLKAGIPAGGLFTGAGAAKTQFEVSKYGGVVGAAHDPCYHQYCDNLRGDGQPQWPYAQLRQQYQMRGNINVDALDINTDAIAVSVLTFGYDTSMLP